MKVKYLGGWVGLNVVVSDCSGDKMPIPEQKSSQEKDYQRGGGRCTGTGVKNFFDLDLSTYIKVHE